MPDSSTSKPQPSTILTALSVSSTSSKLVLKIPPVTPPKRPSRRIPYIELPRLSAAKKVLYKPVEETSMKGDYEPRVDEVIGEHRDGKYLYYFARYDGGIAHKFPATRFEAKRKDLVEEYTRKKREGALAPFDPSAHYIHPLSRVKMTISIKSDRSSRASRSDDEVVPDSEEDYEEETDDVDDNEYNGRRLRNQPPRAARKPATKDLPFSPKKTKSRKVLTIMDSEDSVSEFDDVEEVHPTRRSTRSRKAIEINLVSDDDEYIDEDELARKHKQKGKTSKKTSRPKSALPMYGHFREISTFKDDPFSDDEENEALRRHRDLCEKCHLGPAHKQLAAFKKRSKGKGKKRKRSTDDEFEESDSEQRYIDLGGWVQCLKCPVVAHWKCLANTQREEVLKAVREKDRKEWERKGSEGQPPRKRSELDINQTTEFTCGSCMRGGVCMGCMEIALEPDPSRTKTTNEAVTSTAEDVSMIDGTPEAQDGAVQSLARELLFRCFTCKRLAHYAHLPKPLGFEESSTPDIADHYQTSKSWLCANCSSYKYGLDKIIAWRPYPANAVETPLRPGEFPNYKAHLPREYLVKWAGRSYRRTEWVPHMWLLSTNTAKLKNFVSGGTKVELLKEPLNEDDNAMEVDAPGGPPKALFDSKPVSRASSLKSDAINSAIAALPDAERRIPPPWKTVDRVLDILLWRKSSKKSAGKKKSKRPIALSSDDDDDDDEMKEVTSVVFEKGQQPPDSLTETVDEWEIHDDLEKKDANRVVWAFFKWNELGYEEATWDAPPRHGEPGYEAFKAAFGRFVESRNVIIPKQEKKYWDKFDARDPNAYRRQHMLKDASDLDLGQAPNFKLMPFQVDGFNWLCNNWWTHQHCILADEMGLGKTVQIAAFLGNIADKFKAFPALVVVPNSTITNWVREIERWAPRLRVVPFYGDKIARDIVKQFELFHSAVEPGNLKTKFHILVTTYETLTNAKDVGSVFKSQPRWEVLVVDEGQRLKSDSSLLFKKLNELNTAHRIIMTGTPLNNNIRELFNLMNFLDPEEWRDLEALEKQHEVLDEELVKQLHTRLRPYFLRRIKSEVLELPPKNEVIVPISMAPLQREVYRSILTHNADILKGLTQPGAAQNAPAKTRINNVLMQLRKCLQHPYIYDEDIEPRDVTPQEMHEKLIDASGKLRFLKSLLPKLKERGHRVLLFSQLVIALNVVEDFLAGEGYKFLRLDGNTKNNVRQKIMDEYNKPGSEYFIFLLTTRAGGVGINLFTADTVIIFDPDFNPHQDLQAIARAYRFGQKKTCLVFKLMVKDSAEERIMQIGKKKLVLDHVIVQKMDDDDETGGENVQSILTYGAKALFESEQNIRDITYSDHDVDNLIEKTEKEAVPEAPKAGGGLAFSFAKIWAADKDDLEEVADDDQGDSWAQTLQMINAEREKAQIKDMAQSGRGARRRAADIAKTRMNITTNGSQVFTTTTSKAKKVSKAAESDGSAYNLSDRESEIESDDDSAVVDEDFTLDVSRRSKHPLNAIQNNGHVITHDCGLCGQRHGSGQCAMVERSENLAEYREMLTLHADDEPWEERKAAVQVIDEILHARGHISLIAGQPLHPLAKPIPQPSVPKKVNASKAISKPGPKSVQDKMKSSNHPSSSQSSESVKKKPVLFAISQAGKCVLCGESGPHGAQSCAVAKSDSRSLSTHIRNLETMGDASFTPTINALRSLLSRAKSQEITNGPASKTA
ncbi:unnamed protein product [Cyclocybe aegerita]|uniref:Chromatin remodeling factor mit1 n=1 Tax=Cyclocybe aegerita TaxID=1973307 RepID=A0A8S0X5S0_CYCAE|nr:unnamed protein product [Cyclocybe aegerita]